MAAKKQFKAFAQRQAGVLCHPSSLPSGDFGPDAYYFIDFLSVSGFTLWQVLPLNPVDDAGSPYTTSSSFALDTHFISEQILKQWDWSSEETSGLSEIKTAAAYTYFMANASATDKRRYRKFCNAEAYWLDDYALFETIKASQNKTAWYEWPKSLRDRDEKTLDKIKKEKAEEIDVIKFYQFVVARQWQVLRDYAAEKGVYIFGDLPIFVSHDSVDVWTNREAFHLLKNGHAKLVAGVPPDYFSSTGQRWGNPLYNWPVMQKDDFAWWRQRMQRQLSLYDIIRIDHFRGLEAYWEIKASQKTAEKGKWVKAPGEALFKNFLAHFGPLPLVAEDLGVITEKVTKLRHQFNLPGMKILQFGFEDGFNNAYLPHQHEKDYVAYSGTHDNNTSLGWYRSLNDESKRRVNDYLACNEQDMPMPMVRATLASVAQTAVVPMQDLLGLGSEARLNVPGVKDGNWSWRFSWEQVPKGLSQDLLKLNTLYGRYEVL